MLFLTWSVILPSIFTFIYSHNLSPDVNNLKCASVNHVCSPNTTEPCCDRTNDCKEVKSEENHLFRCTLKTGLGKFCYGDEDCDTISHAKCSKNTCVCRMNNVALNDTICAPILGGFCWKNELCATENSVCVENECQCGIGYSLRLNSRCVRNVIGEYCQNDDDCHQVRFAKCSEKKMCQCDRNTFAISTTHCASILDGFCWSVGDCLIFGSTCTDKKCKCKPGYMPQNNHQCLRAYLGMPCMLDVECSSMINHTVCSESKQCTCDEKHHRGNEQDVCIPFKNLDLFCMTDYSCLKENAMCINNSCQCKPRFIYHGLKCISFYLNEHCETDFDCNLIKNAVCSTDRGCECGPNYVAFNETTCLALLDGHCSEDQDCMAVNAVCMNNKCQCKDNHRRQPNNVCLATVLGSMCQHQADCSSILNSKCSKNGRCECEPNFGEYNTTTCAPFLYGYCSKNKLCAPKNSVCISNVCFCDEGYIMESHNTCRPRNPASDCRTNKDCEQLFGSICLNNICVCQSNNILVNGTTCAPLLGEYCRENQRCASDNSVCIGHMCQCEAKYVKHSRNKCLRITRRSEVPCHENLDCIDVKYSECSSYKKCVCKSNYVALDDDKCIALIGEYCDSDGECFSYNTVCIDHKCGCADKFVMRSEYQCDRKTLGGACRNNHDCTVAIKNANCSEDGICICSKNYHALNAFECAPLLNQYCSTNDDCQFADCTESKCQCRTNYHFASESQCVQTETLYNCNIDLDCGDPWHNKCTYDKKCVCNKHNRFINNSTCSPILNGYCWTNHQCVVENSICVDYRCQCIQNYRAVSNNLCLQV